MEDIIFNPNAPESMNNINNNINAWRPNIKQSDLYPGANDYYNPYFITNIEMMMNIRNI